MLEVDGQGPDGPLLNTRSLAMRSTSAASFSEDTQPVPLCVFFWTPLQPPQPLQPPALLPPLPQLPPLPPLRPRAARGERVSATVDEIAVGEGYRGYRSVQQQHLPCAPVSVKSGPPGTLRPPGPPGPPGSQEPSRPPGPRRRGVVGKGPPRQNPQPGPPPSPSAQDQDRVCRQAWPPPRNASLDRVVRQQCQPSEAGERGEMGSGGRCGSGSARRYSVPEAVMRRCSLRGSATDRSDQSGGEAGEVSSGGEAEDPVVVDLRTRGAPKRRRKRDRHGVDANHNKTITHHRSTKGVCVFRSTQCSTASSFRSDWTATTSTVSTTTCSSCRQQAAMAASTTSSSPTTTTATTVTSATSAPNTVDRLCIHCGGRASGSKPCTPREQLRIAQQQKEKEKESEATQEERVRGRTQVTAASANRSEDAVEESSAAEDSTAKVATVKDPVKVEATATNKSRGLDHQEGRTRKRAHCRLKNVPDEDAHPDADPDLVSGSEGTSTSFNLSLADLSTREASRSDSPSSTPTPTPSPTTFRSRRPSSDRLSTPESLRSGPITEAMGNLHSGSSSTSPDRSVRLTGASQGSSPGTPPLPPQRYASAEASSAESRTPTPPPPPPRHHRKFDDKVHVVSETSSFIILDELNNTDAADAEEEGNRDSDHSAFNSHAGRTARYVRTQQKQQQQRQQQQQQQQQRQHTRRNHWAKQSGKVNESFEVLDDVSDKVPDHDHPPCHECRRRERSNLEVADSKATASKTRKEPRQQRDRDGVDNETEALEKDSLSGSVPDMFGVDEEGNVLFCETGVESRRPSKASLVDTCVAGVAGVPLPQGQPGQPGQPHADEQGQAPRRTHTHGKPVAPVPMEDGDSKTCCPGHNANNHFEETTRCDHHSEEQTFFCGVKEVYSVTTEKVEKWGSESREWLEKTTSHRIQHQHPQQHGVDQQQQRQYHLSNNKPILIASEILEIPPNQRIRPGAFGQSLGRSQPPEGEFSLPCIRQGQVNGQGREHVRDSGREQGNAVHRAHQHAPAEEVSATSGTAHVRFIEDVYGYNVPRTRSIVADLAGSEPAEVQVAVPRYPAVPRSRSMVVNMSSGEEDEDADDSGSDCLSCADSLESEQSPRVALQYDDKPVRGHVAVPAPAATKRVRVQSPKTFFVSLTEEHADEDDVPVSARLPNTLKNRLLHRHTMVKLQMAQNRRFLRTAVRGPSRRRGKQRPSIRVGLLQGGEDGDDQGTRVTVRVERVEHRGDSSPRKDRDEKVVHTVRRDKDKVKQRPHGPSKKEVSPVVRVHKCHVDDEMRTTFKAKPYKLARVNECNEKQEEQSQQRRKVRSQHGHSTKNDAKLRPDERKVKHRTSVRSRDKSSQEKLHETRAKGQNIHGHADNNAEKGRIETVNVRIEKQQGKPGDAKSKDRHNHARESERKTHVPQKNRVNTNRSNEKTTECKSEIISEHQGLRHDEPKDRAVRTTTTARTSEQAVNVASKTKVKHSSDSRTRIEQKTSVCDDGSEIAVAARTRVTRTTDDSAEEARQTGKPGGHTRSTQVSGGDMEPGAHVQTQTTPRVGGEASPPPKTTCVKRTASETTSHLSTQSHSNTETCSKRVVVARPATGDGDNGGEECRVVAPGDLDTTRTTVHTSVRTNLQDSASPSVVTLADNSNSILQNLLQLGAAIENAEIRQKVVEIQTTIQKNVLHHNIVETETTLEKSNVSCMQSDNVSTPLLLQGGGEARSGTATPPGTGGPRPAVCRSLTTSPGPPPRSSRSASGQRFQQRFEPIPEESRTGAEQEDKRTEHSSSRARASLQQQEEYEARGWINFCLTKENVEHEEGVADDVAESTEAEQTVCPTDPTPTPRGPVSKATSPLVPALTVHAVHTVHTATSPIPSARLRCVDAAMCTEEAPAAESGTAAPDSPLPPTPVPAAEKPPKAASKTVTKVKSSTSTRSSAAKTTVSTRTSVGVKPEGKAYRAQGVGTTDHEDAATNTMCGPIPDATRVTLRDTVGHPPCSPSDVATNTLPCEASTSTVCEHDREREREPPRRGPVDASTSTMCGPVLPRRALGPLDAFPSAVWEDAKAAGSIPACCQGLPPVPPRPPDASSSSLCGAFVPQASSHRPSDASLSTATALAAHAAHATSTMAGPVLPVEMPRVPFTEAAVAACTHQSLQSLQSMQSTTMMSMSSCRRTVVTRRERMHGLHIPDISDALSTSSDSTEYMAPPGRSITDGDSTCSPCWRRPARLVVGAGTGTGAGTRVSGLRGMRNRAQGTQGTQGAAPGLYQHHVPPQPQPAGPPPRDGVGWTVTVAGAGTNQQGDLEMRLSFPVEDHDDAKDNRPAKCARSQTANPAVPPGRWSLTIRNQLPGTGTGTGTGDGQGAQRGVSVSMAPAMPQENRQGDNNKGLGGGDGAQRDGGGHPAPVPPPSPRTSPVIVIRRTVPSSPTVSSTRRTSTPEVRVPSPTAPSPSSPAGGNTAPTPSSPAGGNTAPTPSSPAGGNTAPTPSSPAGGNTAPTPSSPAGGNTAPTPSSSAGSNTAPTSSSPAGGNTAPILSSPTVVRPRGQSSSPTEVRFRIPSASSRASSPMSVRVRIPSSPTAATLPSPTSPLLIRIQAATPLPPATP